MQTRELCSGSVLQERAARASSLVCTDLKPSNKMYLSHCFIVKLLQKSFAQNFSQLNSGSVNDRNPRGKLNSFFDGITIFLKLFSVAKGEIYSASRRNKLNVAVNSPKNQLITTF